MTQFLPFISKQNNSIHHHSHGIKVANGLGMYPISQPNKFLYYVLLFFSYIYIYIKILGPQPKLQILMYFRSAWSVKHFFPCPKTIPLELHLALSVACVYNLVPQIMGKNWPLPFLKWNGSSDWYTVMVRGSMNKEGGGVYMPGKVSPPNWEHRALPHHLCRFCCSS